MLFNSLEFLLFFPLVVFLYFLTPYKYRWVLLLTGSYYFYMSWKAEYIILIVISTVIDYICALTIAKSNKKQVKKLFLLLSVFTNLGLLFAFKYFNFVSESLRDFLAQFSISFSPLALNVLLPVGISFYTFQTMSYTIDVYQGKIRPEKHFGIFAVYVSFFPQLVAGPIERAGHLLPQFFEKHDLNISQIKSGLRLMLWGFFKKIVIADRLAVVVDTVFNNTHQFSGLALLVAIFFFGFQIYADFSAYTDIARGAAKILGFRLINNFKQPFFARSVADFWRRWHISLSQWFQDYVFNPFYLKLNKYRIFKNLPLKLKHIVVFSVAMIIGESLLGIWHGANWTYLLFGTYYGILVSFYYLCRKWWDKLPLLIKIGGTFIFINVGWIFFRANSIGDIFYILTNIFPLSLNVVGINIGATYIDLFLIMILILVMILYDILVEINIRLKIAKYTVIKWVIPLIMIWFIFFFGVYVKTPFIYFQF